MISVYHRGLSLTSYCAVVGLDKKIEKFEGSYVLDLLAG
jgi:hypothetical protein